MLLVKTKESFLYFAAESKNHLAGGIKKQRIMEEQRMMKESKREKHNYMDDNEATTTGTERNFSIVVLVTCFICQALSMGFYVSFGTLFVAIVEEFETTETKAGLSF